MSPVQTPKRPSGTPVRARKGPDPLDIYLREVESHDREAQAIPGVDDRAHEGERGRQA